MGERIKLQPNRAGSHPPAHSQNVASGKNVGWDVTSEPVVQSIRRRTIVFSAIVDPATTQRIKSLNNCSKTTSPYIANPPASYDFDVASQYIKPSQKKPNGHHCDSTTANSSDHLPVFFRQSVSLKRWMTNPQRHLRRKCC
jgi:hypothetical protein